uniref:Uncharacterized protein n=1 Tax=Timema bartmani TaxID=61472 RepID=A0A7R9I9K8_9NEOP|nr:unnamed protein product [Timema bartmani]
MEMDYNFINGWKKTQHCRYGSPLVITLEKDQHIIIGVMFARRGSEELLVFTKVLRVFDLDS